MIIERVVTEETRHASDYVRAGLHIKNEYSMWKYVAIMDDGTEVVIRKAATRRYDNAYMYGPDVWSFGKRPTSWRATPTVFKVQDR